MTSRDFCYWLNGFFEIAGPGATLTTEQVGIVQKHLSMVFKHEIDPSFPDSKELNELHNPEVAKVQQSPKPRPMRNGKSYVNDDLIRC